MININALTKYKQMRNLLSIITKITLIALPLSLILYTEAGNDFALPITTMVLCLYFLMLVIRLLVLKENF